MLALVKLAPLSLFCGALSERAVECVVDRSARCASGVLVFYSGSSLHQFEQRCGCPSEAGSAIILCGALSERGSRTNSVAVLAKLAPLSLFFVVR